MWLMTLELQKNYIMIILIGWWHCMNVYHDNLFISNLMSKAADSKKYFFSHF